jgi:negative regulator of flagellin synthesis FlgM
MSISPLGGQDPLRAAAAAAAVRAHAAGTASSGAGAPRQADSVSISETARSLSAAHKAVAEAPDVRADRVSAIKAAIADGSYTIDSRALAAKLLKTSESS